MGFDVWLAAIEATRGSFDGALEAIDRGCGQQLGKRQAEQLARRAAVDFDDFYRARQRPLCDTADTLVLSCDGKGIVMWPSTATATSTTGPTTSPKNASAPTNHATPRTSSRRQHDVTREEPHPTVFTHPR